MPAAAVIPAPIVYIKVVAVKKLVVGFRFLRIIVFDVSRVYWICNFLLFRMPVVGVLVVRSLDVLSCGSPLRRVIVEMQIRWDSPDGISTVPNRLL